MNPPRTRFVTRTRFAYFLVRDWDLGLYLQPGPGYSIVRTLYETPVLFLRDHSSDFPSERGEFYSWECEEAEGLINQKCVLRICSDEAVRFLGRELEPEECAEVQWKR